VGGELDAIQRVLIAKTNEDVENGDEYAYVNIVYATYVQPPRAHSSLILPK
jgi:hypothetical protein